VPGTKPNIILIITDQQRYDTINALGYDYMETPNLDKLVTEGISFDNCFITAPSCAPSRASLFTGYYPHTTHIFKNGDPWTQTWVPMLSQAGYFTANIGKMHLTPFDSQGQFDFRFNMENKQRFRQWSLYVDEWDKALAARKMDKYQRDELRERASYEEDLGAFIWEKEPDMHSDNFLADSAIRWIERYSSNQPFFLEIGFPGPHPPYDPTPEWADKYLDKNLPMLEVTNKELESQPPPLHAMRKHNVEVDHDSIKFILNPTDEQRHRQRALYLANVSMIDQKIGQIMDTLEQRGFLENSIVIFTSDHGDAMTDHGASQKWTMYDCVTRVPLIVRAPERFQKGQRVEGLCQWMDIGPTILELAGIEPPSSFEAISLLPALQGNHSYSREYVFAEHSREDVVGLHTDFMTMVRSRDWKLVHFLDEPYGQLFNLRDDPDEVDNLWDSDKHKSQKTEMLDVLREWLIRSHFKTNDWGSDWR
tara:strand:- start:7997 stop:9430 length:1434 start_codon:yes stop_codon:yes gene_type:complete